MLMEIKLRKPEHECTYENIIATCPYCGQKTTFNRHDDFQSIAPITRREVQCEEASCQKSFVITGDFVPKSKFEYLLYDCIRLRENKQYMYCILHLVQACESFFSSYLYIELVYKPYTISHTLLQDIEGDVRLTEISDRLYNLLVKQAYQHLQNIFINSIIQGINPTTFNETEKILNRFGSLVNMPGDKDIQGIQNQTLSLCLQRLKNSNIGRLRNQVVHQFAYRPSRKEVDSCFDEVTDILYQLDDVFDIHDNIGWYTK